MAPQQRGAHLDTQESDQQVFDADLPAPQTVRFVGRIL